MSLLTWNFDKNIIYVIVYWVLEIVYHILLSNEGQFFKITNDTVHDEYIFVILYNISDLLAGFFIMYNKCTSKPKKNEDKEEIKTQKSDLIYTQFDKLKKSFYIKLIIIVLLDYISRSSSWISNAITKAYKEKISHSLQKNIKITLDIIMRYIFSVFILKVIVYKHRTFSMVTIGIGLIIFMINDILLMFFDNLNNYNIGKYFFYTAIASISGITYPLEDTLMKQIFSEEYLYPANMQFYRAIVELILISIITPILYFSFNIDLKFNTENISLVIPTTIFSALAAFIKAFIIIKIIYHYSSQSVSFLRISQSFSGSITKLINIFTNEISNDKWKICLIILEIISILIILFASLVYDEIIIINKCELNKNVKLGIINRGESEVKNINLLRESNLDDSQFVDNESIDINE